MKETNEEQMEIERRNKWFQGLTVSRKKMEKVTSKEKERMQKKKKVRTKNQRELEIKGKRKEKEKIE